MTQRWYEQQSGAWFQPSALGTAYVGATPRADWGGGLAGSWVGATPRSDWGGGFAALGVAVPTPLPGQPNYAPDMIAKGYAYCGSKFGFQQMLQDLGYYQAPLTGKIDGPTVRAAQSFAADHGIAWSSAGLTDAFCQKLIGVWKAQMAAAPTLTPTMERPSNGDNGAPAPAPSPTPSPAPAPAPSPAPSNGAPAPKAGPIEKAKAWWGAQSTGTKAAVGVGGALLVGLLIYALSGAGGGVRATPNRHRYRPNRRKKKLTAKQKAALERIRGKRAKARTGKITTLKSGKKFGHLKPPKRYWKMGAKRPKDYAAPEHYQYPLIFRNADGTVNVKQTKRHISNAKSRFKQHKRRYPMKLRRKIAKNINQAARRYGMAANVKP